MTRTHQLGSTLRSLGLRGRRVAGVSDSADDLAERHLLPLAYRDGPGS